MKKVTDGEIGERGSKIWCFCSDFIFECPLRENGCDNNRCSREK